MSLFTRIRSAASKLAHGWGEKAIESAFELPPSRLPLLGFAKDTVDKWQLQTDSPIGGFSECSLTPFHAGIHVDDAPRLLRPSAMWAGHTSLDADRLIQQQFEKSDQKAVASKVGFAAMMLSVENAEWPDLHDYHGLCLTCRPQDARQYVVTMRAANVLGDHRTEDLYQTMLQPFVAHAKPVEASERALATIEELEEMMQKTNSVVTMLTERSDGTGEVMALMDRREGAEARGLEWNNQYVEDLLASKKVAPPPDVPPLIDVRLPWGAFRLTWRGYVQGVEQHPPPMHLDRISHVGLLLADKTAGGFGIELANISAFRYDEDEMVRDEHVRQCMELNRQAGYDDVVSG